MLIITKYNTTIYKTISHISSYNGILLTYILMNAIPRFNFEMEEVNYMVRTPTLKFLCKFLMKGC